MFPITLDLSDRPCLVVGGGNVAQRKVEALLAAGATVTVVSPQTTARLRLLAEQRLISVIPATWDASLLGEHSVVIVATDDRELNREIAKGTRGSGRLVNVVDEPGLCDFFVPAVVRRGHLTVSVSTDGRCPALSAAMRQELEGTYGPEYERLTDLAGEVRDILMRSARAKTDSDRILGAILRSDLATRLRAGEELSAEALIREFE